MVLFLYVHSFIRGPIVAGVLSSSPSADVYCGLVFGWATKTGAAIVLLAFTESIHIVEAVKGTIGRLPCNITPSVKGDKIILVIWYKDGYSLPIYR